MSYLVTEYIEQNVVKNAQYLNESYDSYSNDEVSYVEDMASYVEDEASYVEDEASYVEDSALAPDIKGPSKYSSGEDSADYNEDDDTHHDVNHSEDKKVLPGSNFALDDVEPEPEPEPETDWVTHRDPKHFMTYINDMYPSKIPQHDGKSTLGCERAINFLLRLNKEISEALRGDLDNLLDIGQLESVRTNMAKDVAMLKDHVKNLNKDRSAKKAAEEAALQKQAEITKLASTPTIQLVMTPFERAITGIILNATVSAGKPLEDVYSYLKDKYKIDDREELSIMQLLRDMGHPMFKDRGTFGKPGKKDENAQGVDFIKNYFA